jgi:hypothetical protein
VMPSGRFMVSIWSTLHRTIQILAKPRRPLLRVSRTVELGVEGA